MSVKAHDKERELLQAQLLELQNKITQLEEDNTLLRSKVPVAHSDERANAISGYVKEDQSVLLNGIFKALPDLVYVVEAKTGKPVFTNLSESYLGYSKKEILNFGFQFVDEKIHPDDLDRVKNEYSEKLKKIAQGEVFVSEFRYKSKAGEWHNIVSRDAPFSNNEDGTVKEYIGIARDISHRYQAIKAVELGKSLYMTIAQNFPKGFVLVFDLDLKFLFAEGPLLKTLGYRPAEIRGFDTKHRLPDGNTWEHLETSYKKVLRGDNLTFIATDQGKHYHIHIIPLKDEHDVIYAGMQVTQEITEQISAKEELEKRVVELAQTNLELERYIASNLELEQFAYIAAHDLKEPIRTIISFSQLLEHRFKESVNLEAKEYINYIVDGTRRMQALIDGLLEYSQVGKEGNPFSKIDMNNIIEGVLTNINSQIQQKGIEIFYDALPEIYGDSTQIAQVCQNIVSNGIKFNENESPEIHISADKRLDYWHFQIKDNGIGIPTESRERIFSIFRRLHTREEYQGAGIGLSVCKRIVERHGGKIWVESIPEISKGTIFHFTVPVRIG